MNTRVVVIGAEFAVALHRARRGLVAARGGYSRSPRMPASALASMCAPGRAWVFHEQRPPPHRSPWLAGLRRSRRWRPGCLGGLRGAVRTAPTLRGELTGPSCSSGSTGTPRPVG